MKNLFFLLTSLLLIVIFPFYGCKKHKPNYSDNGLPPASQTGANIFACRINGKALIANNNIYGMGGGHKDDTIGFFGSVGDINYFDHIAFTIFDNSQDNISLNLSDSNDIKCLFGTDSTCFGQRNLITIYPTIGALKLTKLDIVSKIISGTFNFLVPIPGCDTLKVTDGRFDIRYVI